MKSRSHFLRSNSTSSVYFKQHNKNDDMKISRKNDYEVGDSVMIDVKQTKRIEFKL